MKVLKWIAAGALLVVLVLGGVALALQRWLASEDFRARVAQQVSTAVGVPVQFGHIEVDFWPLPAVTAAQVQIRSQPAVTLERVEARPVWAALLQRRLEISTLVVRQAVIPERGVAAIVAAASRKPAGAKAQPTDIGAVVGLMPRRTVLDDVTWIDSKGNGITFDAQAQLDATGWPGTASVHVRKGRFEGAEVAVRREGEPWIVEAQVGGGKVTGTLQWRAGAARGAGTLQGEFDTAGVEVSALTAPSRMLTGRVEAHTTLRAEVRDPSVLIDVLQSQTRFTVRNAVVHGIDLMQAVKTVGLNRGGETRLDTLAGTVATQGRTVHLNNLVATSGVLSANGNVVMAPNHSLSGRITVELAAASAGGTIGVPLAVGGTLESPSVTLTRGALLGAAIGTAIAPGVGTGAGANLGDRLGSGLRGLFK